MKRFLEKNSKGSKSEKDAKLCMEDAAKLNIKNRLLEKCEFFGVSLHLLEQDAGGEQKVEQKKPIFSSPENERFYNAIKVPETGTETNPYIFTRGPNSTAYGPVQITASTLRDFNTRYPDLFKDNQEYVQKYLAQADKFRANKNLKDPTFGRGGVGELGGEEYREAYMRMSDAVIQGMRSDMERLKKMKPGEFNIPVMTQRWRGVPRNEDEKYYAAVESEMQKKSEPAPQAPVMPPTVSKPQEPPPQPTTQKPGEEYSVKAGDTLSGIAKRTGKSVEDLARENNITDPNKIKVGQKIRI